MSKQKSLLQRMEEEDEEDIQMLEATLMDIDSDEKQKPVYGRGNAKRGFKEKYKLYPSSDVFHRVE